MFAKFERCGSMVEFKAVNFLPFSCLKVFVILKSIKAPMLHKFQPSLLGTCVDCRVAKTEVPIPLQQKLCLDFSLSVNCF